jgi:hypothetical protein
MRFEGETRCPSPGGSGMTNQIETATCCATASGGGAPGLSLQRYAPRRGRFGLRAGGPTIFSGPSRSPTGTYSRSRSPV